jgi:hypothetical protein
VAKPRQKPGSEIQREKLVEEFCALDREIENYKPRLQRHEMLRSLILNWFPDLADDTEMTVAGIDHDVLITARDRIRTVTPLGRSKLFKLWGKGNFITKCVVHLKALPDPQDPDGLYTVPARIGPRHLHVVAKAQNTAETAA